LFLPAGASLDQLSFPPGAARRTFDGSGGPRNTTRDDEARVVALKREVLPDGSKLYSDAVGSFSVRRLKAGVVMQVYKGRVSKQFYDEIVGEHDRELASAGRLRMIADTSELRGVDTGYRDSWTAWLKKNRPLVDPIIMLVNSRLVAMAASVVNLALGGNLLNVYSNRPDFDAAVSAVVPDWDRSRRSAG
jgi:hypothetical protein